MNVYFPYPKMFSGSWIIAASLAQRGHNIVPWQENIMDIEDVDVVVSRISDSVSGRYRESVLLQTQALQTRGARAYNPAGSQLIMRDKNATNLVLSQAGVAIPAFCTSQQDFPARGCIVKPAVGCKGNGVRWVKTWLEVLLAKGDDPLCVVQEYIDGPTIRVIATDKKALFAYGKILPQGSTHVVANIAQGAESVQVELTQDMADLAVAAVAAVGATLAGVDIIIDPERGPLLLELNSGFRVPTEYPQAIEAIVDCLEGQ